MSLYNILDPVLYPLLDLGSLFAIIIISAILAVIITLVHKYMTDQKEMRRLKDQVKMFQKQIKEHRNDPKKSMEIQKKAMEVNSSFMMKSMKPTLITFIPILIIFGWLSAHMAYHPIMPNDTFSIDMEFKDASEQLVSMNIPQGLILISDANQTIKDDLATWELKASEIGKYKVQIIYGDNNYTQEIIISNEIGDYAPVEKRVKNSDVKTITTDLNVVRPFGNFTFFGWQPNWIWTYIIFSVIFSISLRKALKIV